MHTKSRSDPTICLLQMSPLSINLGGMTMIVGGFLLVFIWVMLKPLGQFIFLATWATLAFCGFWLKRNLIAIDQERREVRVQACWCLFSYGKIATYRFDTLHQKVNETDSGRELVLYCPDGNRVAIYKNPALEILSDVISNESRPRSCPHI